MRKVLLVAWVFSCLVAGSLPVTKAHSFNLATMRSVNSIWKIEVDYPSGGPKFPPISSSGTTWVIHSYKGIGTFWVTNRHVLEYYPVSAKNLAKDVFLLSPSTTSTYLKVLAVAKSNTLDVAIVKTEYDPDVQSLHINYRQVPYGTEVTSVGYGFPNENSKDNLVSPNYPWISSGILTSSSQVWLDRSVVSGMLLHSNTIYHGNSGGPLLDLQGNVIGMDSCRVGDSSCAIPVNLVASNANNLIAGMQFGRG